MLRRLARARAAVALIALASALLFVWGSSWPDQAGAEAAGAVGEETAARAETGRAASRSAPGQPDLDATSWALVDTDTGLYLAGKNPDERLPIASTTNVMVALVALEKGVDFDEEVTISEQAERFVGLTYSNVGLITSERLSVRDVLVAALVPSGTEAVYALAAHLGGGSVGSFVEKMNKKSDSMGLKNTRFENPAGLDASGHYSSARDLASIARAAMDYPAFREIVGTEKATITTQSRDIEVFNTNNLLYNYQNATGVKTGASPGAGPCLIASAENGDESYIAVILDAESEDYRFEAAQRVLEYGFNNYEREALVSQGRVYRELQLPFRRGESVELAAAKDVPGLTGPHLEVERRVTEEELPPEAEVGQELGRVEVLIDGRSIGSSPLVAREGYEEASLWEKARYAVGWPVQRLWDSLRGWLSRRLPAPA